MLMGSNRTGVFPLGKMPSRNDGYHRSCLFRALRATKMRPKTVHKFLVPESRELRPLRGRTPDPRGSRSLLTAPRNAALFSPLVVRAFWSRPRLTAALIPSHEEANGGAECFNNSRHTSAQRRNVLAYAESAQQSATKR